MADRTFESQQYASQEGERANREAERGVAAVSGALGAVGAALERHGDRMAQRELQTAQLAQNQQQLDAGIRQGDERLAQGQQQLAQGQRQLDQNERQINAGIRQGDERIQQDERRANAAIRQGDEQLAMSRRQLDMASARDQRLAELEQRRLGLERDVAMANAFFRDQSLQVERSQVALGVAQQQASVAQFAQRMEFEERQLNSVTTTRLMAAQARVAEAQAESARIANEQAKLNLAMARQANNGRRQVYDSLTKRYNEGIAVLERMNESNPGSPISQRLAAQLSDISKTLDEVGGDLMRDDQELQRVIEGQVDESVVGPPLPERAKSRVSDGRTDGPDMSVVSPWSGQGTPIASPRNSAQIAAKVWQDLGDSNRENVVRMFRTKGLDHGEFMVLYQKALERLPLAEQSSPSSLFRVMVNSVTNPGWGISPQQAFEVLRAELDRPTQLSRDEAEAER